VKFAAMLGLLPFVGSEKSRGIADVSTVTVCGLSLLVNQKRCRRRSGSAVGNPVPEMRLFCVSPM